MLAKNQYGLLKCAKFLLSTFIYYFLLLSKVYKDNTNAYGQNFQHIRRIYVYITSASLNNIFAFHFPFMWTQESMAPNFTNNILTKVRLELYTYIISATTIMIRFPFWVITPTPHYRDCESELHPQKMCALLLKYKDNITTAKQTTLSTKSTRLIVYFTVLKISNSNLLKIWWQEVKRIASTSVLVWMWS